MDRRYQSTNSVHSVLADECRDAAVRRPMGEQTANARRVHTHTTSECDPIVITARHQEQTIVACCHHEPRHQSHQNDQVCAHCAILATKPYSCSQCYCFSLSRKVRTRRYSQSLRAHFMRSLRVFSASLVEHWFLATLSMRVLRVCVCFVVDISTSKRCTAVVLTVLKYN